MLNLPSCLKSRLAFFYESNVPAYHEAMERRPLPLHLPGPKISHGPDGTNPGIKSNSVNILAIRWAQLHKPKLQKGTKSQSIKKISLAHHLRCNNMSLNELACASARYVAHTA